MSHNETIVHKKLTYTRHINNFLAKMFLSALIFTLIGKRMKLIRKTVYKRMYSYNTADRRQNVDTIS